MVYGARAGDALDGRSVRRLFAHRLRHNFQRSSGERRCPGVARLMQGFVPLMAIIWVLTSMVICVINIGQLPHVIWSIFESAFGWQEAAGGAAGYTLSR
ncbi:amino acid carrier protein [Shigella sonnei]|nr:amino acid carrier protein [Shigella sonnei]